MVQFSNLRLKLIQLNARRPARINMSIIKHLSTKTRAAAATAASASKTKTKSKKKPFFTLTLITLLSLTIISIREQRHEDKEMIRPSSSIPLYLYSYLPLNVVSRLWGQFNNIDLPVYLREPSFKFYSTIFGVELDEMLDPKLSNYKNLSEFFYRQLKPESRLVDPTALINLPSDGKILKFGKVDPNGEIEQVKGMTYSLEALLGSSLNSKLAKPTIQLNYDNHGDDHDTFLNYLESNTNKDIISRNTNEVSLIEEGDQSSVHPSISKVLKVNKSLKSDPNVKTDLFYAVIYLAPGDYHRFHSPVTWVTTLRRHFIGELYSVAPYFQKSFNNLFVINERVALLGYWKYGFFSMTPVGATNVGSIVLNFDQKLLTNVSKLDNEITKKGTCYEASYENASSLLKGEPLFKGEEMGGFKLGSTVVLVFEAPSNFKFDVELNDKVKMGQSLGHLEEE